MPIRQKWEQFRGTFALFQRIKRAQHLLLVAISLPNLPEAPKASQMPLNSEDSAFQSMDKPRRPKAHLNKGKENLSELMAALERFWQPSRLLRPSAKSFERRVREGVLTCEHDEAVVNWTLQHSLDVTDVLMTQNTKW